MSEINPLDLDVRIIRRDLNKGFLSEADVAKRLVGLPDVEAMGEYFDPATLGEADEAREAPASTDE
jgi:hypothetical protein